MNAMLNYSDSLLKQVVKQLRSMRYLTVGRSLRNRPVKEAVEYVLKIDGKKAARKIAEQRDSQGMVQIPVFVLKSFDRDTIKRPEAQSDSIPTYEEFGVGEDLTHLN